MLAEAAESPPECIGFLRRGLSTTKKKSNFYKSRGWTKNIMVYRTAIRKNTPIAQTHSYFSNNFKLSASTIAQFYKARWMIEIYFRNIKQL